jgi:hypothetical protein
MLDMIDLLSRRHTKVGGSARRNDARAPWETWPIAWFAKPGPGHRKHQSADQI